MAGYSEHTFYITANFFIVKQGGLEIKIQDLMLMASLHEGVLVVWVESQLIGLTDFILNEISDKVDLGLNLINFKYLDRIGSWFLKSSNIIREL